MQSHFIKESVWLDKVRAYMRLMGWRWTISPMNYGTPTRQWVKYYPSPSEVLPAMRDRLSIIALYGDPAWKIDVKRAMRMTKDEGYSLIKTK